MFWELEKFSVFHSYEHPFLSKELATASQRRWYYRSTARSPPSDDPLSPPFPKGRPHLRVTLTCQKLPPTSGLRTADLHLSDTSVSSHYFPTYCQEDVSFLASLPRLCEYISSPCKVLNSIM
ncbi:hypothetical protein KP509_26G037200 [Ceratopteris richardii]|uniref:Uncharacterized protein n=1 Tax=Ceratopteris richardii TaxID=49495 RepID=A0A8T2RMF5_CERRI|nr:hypothetical protein KP509_26G037200 [Ceratopteris richardii]